MKILHVIFSLNIGGAETMLVDIINEQVKYAKVYLIIINNSYDKELLNNIDKNIEVQLINRKPGSLNLLKVFKINKLIYKIRPNVIHTHNHDIINIIKYKGSATTCLTAHTTGINIKNFKKYDQLFAISNAVQKEIKRGGGPNSKVIYNGIKFNLIKSKELHLVKKEFKILQVGRLNYKVKGQDVLLKAVSLLVHERGIKNIKVDFIGDKVFPEDLADLKALAKMLNITDSISFLGAKNREFVYENLRNYDLLVQPSHFEGFGLTVVEAMVAKVPVLISDVEGPMEVIGEGRYGEYFKAGDFKDCAYKIESLMMGTSKLKQSLIEEGYKHCLKKFDITTTAYKYIKFYFKHD